MRVPPLAHVPESVKVTWPSTETPNPSSADDSAIDHDGRVSTTAADVPDGKSGRYPTDLTEATRHDAVSAVAVARDVIAAARVVLETALDGR